MFITVKVIDYHGRLRKTAWWNMQEPEYLTVQEVADRLRVDRQVVWNLIRKKQLAAYKVGGQYRILLVDLQEYLRKQRIEPD
jgi:excisionase family DNA binding protein